MGEQMRAVLSKAPGGPESLVIDTIPIPEPGPNEVRIRVHAVGINYPDLLIIKDLYQFKPERPFSPGAEISGVVEAVGRDVRDLREGQRVMAMVGWGGMAEYVCATPARCPPIPDEMPWDEAAAFLMTYGTAYHGLHDRAGLREGETLLVLGAAGGVGLAAVELGKALGARVVAAASSQDKLAIASKMGADAEVLYDRGELGLEGQKELAKKFKAACGDRGADVILDPVGGEFCEPALRSIAWEGRYLVVGFPAGIPRLPLNLPLLKSCDVMGVFWGAAIDRNPSRHAEAIGELLELYEAGKIKPAIHDRFPLEKAADALNELSQRNVAGKVVLLVPDVS